MNLQQLITEGQNPASMSIDEMSALEIVTVINQEDKKVALAVERILPEIAQAVEVITAAIKAGGRLIYIGAGTSGRLGVLDASECPPTYGTAPELIVGLIAGGQQAMFHAVENAEDSRAQGECDLKALHFNTKDVLVGIAASGRTPYVLGALAYANQLGAVTMSISCNPNSPVTTHSQIAMTPVVGPEVVTGSSRMKAGTAQKLVLNMLTTATMIRLGKVYGNLMVDVQATNEKLIERQKQIVMKATQCSYSEAELALKESGQHCKTAIVMLLLNVDAACAKALLQRNDGFIRHALQDSFADCHEK